MSKRNILQFTASLSVLLLCAVLFLSPTVTTPDIIADNTTVTEKVITVDEVAAPTEQTVETPVIKEYTEEQLKVRFASMLNLNRCYGSAFDGFQGIAKASALALFDYSTDVAGYDLCVNTCLVEGFAKSFYGVALTEDCLNSTDAPNGYFAMPVFESGTQLHKVVSVTKNGDVYEVFSEVTTYYGGDDTESSLAKSTFVVDSKSEFGFNLTYCEIL